MPVTIFINANTGLQIIEMKQHIWRQKELIKAHKRELAKMQLQLAKLKSDAK